MITEQQAIQLVRAVCECLAVPAGLILAAAGLHWLRHPLGGRVCLDAPILYFRKGRIGGRTVRFPTVDLRAAGDPDPYPVTVRTARARWTERPGDVLTVTMMPGRPDDVRAYAPGRPVGWAVAVMALGVGLAGAFALRAIPDVCAVLDMLRSGI